MNLILILTFFYFIQLTIPSQAADTSRTKLQARTNSKISKDTPTKNIKLKSNEYSLNYEINKTKVFSTKLYEGLLLSQNCFKKKTPSCQAYSNSLQGTNIKPEENMKSPFHNNLGAIHCELMGGKGLIAKTFEGNDDDFCLFSDESMVSSWSAYYKTHPQIQSK